MSTWLIVVCGFAAHASSAGPAAPSSIADAVDHYIDERLREEGVTPAPAADSATLLRRLTLDLAGRIPTVAEYESFTSSADTDKTLKLVERLMASSGFARHQATEYDRILMAGYRATMRDYLLRAAAENRPWDRVFRDVMLPDDADPAKKGATAFLKARVTDLDKLTAEVSSIFFGVNVSCAQCHDHPLVADWKQDHFYGLKSFFGRTFDNGGFVAERGVGRVQFVTTKGASRDARMMFLTGATVDTDTAREPTAEERKKDRELFDGFKTRKAAPPQPSFSAREKLVELSLRSDQRSYFAKAAVNRVWHRLFGRGLVMPLDQMHSENPPSHPELLDRLASDFAEHDYDVNRLVRGLVMSRAYARSSRWDNGSPPNPNLFAVARPRPLSPTQLATSMRLAVADPQLFAFGASVPETERRIEALESSARGFAATLDPGGEDSQIGVAESLLLSNGDRFQKEYLVDGGDRLLTRLGSLDCHCEVVDLAVRTVLSRVPTDDEQETLSNYLAKRHDRQQEARRQLVWALLTSAEFRFNY